MRILIIDSDQNIREQIERLLRSSLSDIVGTEETIYNSLLTCSDSSVARINAFLYLKQMSTLEFTHADRSDKAYKILENERFDLVFIDPKSPGGQGPLLLQKLREQELVEHAAFSWKHPFGSINPDGTYDFAQGFQFPQLVIVLAGSLGAHELHLLTDLDISNFIKKPCTDDLFVEKIKPIFLSYLAGASHEAFLTETDKLAQENKFPEMIESIKVRIRSYGKSLKLFCHLASAYIQSGDLVAGEDLIAKLKKMAPDSYLVNSVSAKLSILKGDLTTASSLLASLEEKSPLNVKHNLTQALLAKQCEKTDIAISHYEKALKKLPGNEAASLGLAQLLREKGRNSEARAILSKINNRDEVISGMNLHGILAAKRQEYDKAIIFYSNVIDLLPETDPRLQQVCFNLGLSFYKNKKLDEAQKVLTFGDSLAPRRHEKTLRLLAAIEKELNPSPKEKEVPEHNLPTELTKDSVRLLAISSVQPSEGKKERSVRIERVGDTLVYTKSGLLSQMSSGVSRGNLSLYVS